MNFKKEMRVVKIIRGVSGGLAIVCFICLFVHPDIGWFVFTGICAVSFACAHATVLSFTPKQKPC